MLPDKCAGFFLYIVKCILDQKLNYQGHSMGSSIRGCSENHAMPILRAFDSNSTVVTDRDLPCRHLIANIQGTMVVVQPKCVCQIGSEIYFLYSQIPFEVNILLLCDMAIINRVQSISRFSRLLFNLSPSETLIFCNGKCGSFN